MRNLKRALSLALASIMVLGLMMTGAGAAYKDFTDKDEIKHEEAVKTLTTLNVIAGKEDGSYYDPTGTLTRAEMAKLITYVLNGGTEPVLGTKTTPTYSDIKGHWAEAYIEYCTSMGIIAGDGAGKFNPQGTLTGSQAAKMLLVAMNYKSDIFGFTGGSWEINVNREANSAKLYDELGGMNPAAAISRDDAAQLVYNAIQSKTMKLNWNQNQSTGEITQGYQLTGASLFADKFNGEIYEGVLQASGRMNPYGNTQSGKDKIAIWAVVKDGEDITPAAAGFKYEDDSTALIGEYVKVLYSTKSKEAYGVYGVDSKNTVVLETTRGAVGVIKAGDTEVKIDGTNYDFSAAIGATNEPDAYATAGALNVAAWTAAKDFDDTEAFGNDNRSDSYVKLVDNTGDGKIDVAIIIDATLETVNYVGSDKMTLTTLGSVKTADMNLGDKTPAVDDKVFVTPKIASFNGNYGVAVAETVEGKASSVRRATVGGVANVVTAVQVDGTWYNLKATASTAKLENAGGAVIADDKGNPVALDSTYKLYIRGSYAYAADIITSGGTAVGVITGVTSNKDFDNNTQLRMLKSDGEVVTAYMGWATGYSAAFAEGQLVTYTVSNDVYTLYPAGNTSGSPADDQKAMGGYDAAVGVGTAPSNASDSPVATGAAFVNTSSVRTIAGMRIDDSAIVFVQYDSNTGKAGLQSAWKVVSGKDVNAWKTAYGAAGAGMYKTSGLGYLGVAVLTATANQALPGASSQYAYVTSNLSYGSDFVTYSIWDGTSDSSVTVTEKVSSSAAVKGGVISFDWDGDATVKNVAAVTNRGALTYTNGNQVKISGVGYDLAKDATVLNVDTDDKIGVSGTAVTKAQMTNTQDVYYQNVAYKLNSDGEVDLLVVDVINNRWIGAGNYNDAIGGFVAEAGTTSAALKAAQDGTYIPTDTAFAPGDVAGAPADNRIFKFTTNDNTKTYTLTIKNSAGTTVYTETLATPADGGHYFWITTNPVEANAGTLAGTWSTTGAVPSGTYTYAVNDGSADVLSGSFTA